VYIVQGIFQRYVPAYGFDKAFALEPHAVVERYWVWQLVTASFLHAHWPHIFHIAFNMLALWFFGIDVEQRLGARRFLMLYFLSAIYASLAFVAFGILSDRPFDHAVGASGAVMGVLVFFALTFPDRLVLFMWAIPMKARTLAFVLVGLDVLYFVLSPGTGIANSAHLGGALFGFLYFRYADRLGEYFIRLEARRKQREVESEEAMRRRVDLLLEKISREGMHMLTERERRFLRDASRKFQQARNRVGR
jgi:membrane associated rhomboid family serine protease